MCGVIARIHRMTFQIRCMNDSLAEISGWIRHVRMIMRQSNKQTKRRASKQASESHYSLLAWETHGYTTNTCNFSSDSIILGLDR